MHVNMRAAQQQNVPCKMMAAKLNLLSCPGSHIMGLSDMGKAVQGHACARAKRTLLCRTQSIVIL